MDARIITRLMKFAFSNSLCAQWDLDTLITRAKEYGYDGVELSLPVEQLASGQVMILGADVEKVKSSFTAAGVEVAALASAISYRSSANEDGRSAKAIEKLIEVAQQIGCPMVKIRDGQVRRGQMRSAVATGMARWLTPAADMASACGVSIAIKNCCGFRTAEQMWLLLELIEQPSVGCCWDVLKAQVAGEGPVLSVPMLNSRIFCVEVNDAKIAESGPQYCNLGEGDVQLAKFLTRLQGIGYDGWVTLALESSSTVGQATNGGVFIDARQKLRQWTQPKPTASSSVVKKPAKPPESVAVAK